MSNARPLIGLPPRDVDPCATLLANDTQLSRMAHELARDLYPLETVIQAYNITKEDFAEKILNHPAFMAFYAEGRELWNANTNVGQRVALKSGHIFEQWLGEADKLLHDPNSPVADKVKLASYLSRLAGFENVNPPPARDAGVTGQGGAATHVTINLGHGRKIEVHKEVIDAKTVEAEVVELEQLRATTGDPYAVPGHVVPVQGPAPHSPVPQTGSEGRKPEGEMRVMPRGPIAATRL